MQTDLATCSNFAAHPFKRYEFHSCAVRVCRDTVLSNYVPLFETACILLRLHLKTQPLGFALWFKDGAANRLKKLLVTAAAPSSFPELQAINGTFRGVRKRLVVSDLTKRYRTPDSCWSRWAWSPLPLKITLSELFGLEKRKNEGKMISVGVCKAESRADRVVPAPDWTPRQWVVFFFLTNILLKIRGFN